MLRLLQRSSSVVSASYFCVAFVPSPTPSLFSRASLVWLLCRTAPLLPQQSAFGPVLCSKTAFLVQCWRSLVLNLASPFCYELQKHRTSINRMTNSLSMKNGICNAGLGLGGRFVMHDCDYYEYDTFAQDICRNATIWTTSGERWVMKAAEWKSSKWK